MGSSNIPHPAVQEQLQVPTLLAKENKSYLNLFGEFVRFVSGRKKSPKQCGISLVALQLQQMREKKKSPKQYGISFGGPAASANVGGKTAQSNVEFPLMALQLQQMREKKKSPKQYGISFGGPAASANVGGKTAQSNVEFPLMALQLQQMLEKKKIPKQYGISFDGPAASANAGEKKSPKQYRISFGGPAASANVGGKKAQSNVEFPWWPCSFSKCGRKKKPKAIRSFLLALPLQQMLARCLPRLNYGNTMLSESKLRVGRP
ncbi:uncharacterized protein LOC143973429 [Lithobates pipiens]